MGSATTIHSANSTYRRLKVAIVENTTPISPILRSVMNMMEITGVRVYADNKRTLDDLEQGQEADVLFLNWCGDRNDPLELARSLRGRRTFPLAFTAMVVMLSNVTRESVLAARDAGIDEFLAVPFTPAGLNSRIQCIVNDRRGFVDIPTYFGPDRRRGVMANYLQCSRSGESVLIDPRDGRRYRSHDNGSRRYIDDKRAGGGESLLLR